MPKPKTAKDIIDRFKKDLETVYGVRYDKQGQFDWEESAMDIPKYKLRNIIRLVEREVTRVGDPKGPPKFFRDQPIDPEFLKKIRERRERLKLERKLER